ncbi:tail length tape measure protein [Aphanothece hegewaldii CCALA 016]|uniref:Tail length tape measure protein n=1 Tax=Aphanothece hegewaldii CCALA 016 TaxID=2107694 RepID=A0A2T1LZQ1_9CHRO|nr:transglycosylase SLT domain-containing protein [Aphanothece hegewaldii]PSF37876.1 tail length tape measure protein [Aphanothece hegewaldii CCALA 016]
MLKNLKGKSSLIMGISSGLLLLAIPSILILNPEIRERLEQQTPLNPTSQKSFEAEKNQPSIVMNLVSLSAEEQETQLRKIADSNQSSLDRSRARYLLASILLKKFEGGPALRLLQGLDKEYPVLAPQILLKQGRAYELSNEPTKSQEVWKKIIERYPDSPVAADALYNLGKTDPQYWEQAIKQFPRHPRTHDIILKRLKDNPNQPQLLLNLLRNSLPNEPFTNQARDRLVQEFSQQLTPSDWELIADGYWDQNLYKKAAAAYQKASPSPRQAYRMARYFQIDNQIEEAKLGYKKLIKLYPDALPTALGLLRLADLSRTQDAIIYLDLVAKQFPLKAPQALLKKADLLARSGNATAANQARQTLINQYATSDEAAELRWKIAGQYADNGDFVKAWSWAQPITVNNGDSSIAPKAAFWVGKWARKLGKEKEAKEAFTHTVGRYPSSYYAWRSANLLGWPVGDFETVRALTPTIQKPTQRPIPPFGSDAFKELYRLGEKQQAWELFQAEIVDPTKLTVAEQFTYGLLLLDQNRNIEAINQIWQLKERETPEEQSQWKALRETLEYWQALFPFPYYDLILKWSQERQLNPLLVTALIRQESRFEKDIKSPVGATGLMQLMPATAKMVADNLNIKEYSLTKPDNNINFGTWYFDYTHKTYDNNSMFAVASYNAGPGNVSKWITKYNSSDHDEFVENIPFKETKGYVESVFGNYWNYQRIYNPEIAQLLEQIPKSQE